MRRQWDERESASASERSCDCAVPVRPWIVCSLAAAVLAGVAALAFGASNAVGASCTNASFRAGLSAYLPECRAYEMVSPPFKDGTSVARLMAASQDGERAVFTSVGVFAGSPSDDGFNSYLAARSASAGWAISPLDPPAQLTPFGEVANPVDFNASLSESIVVGLLGASNGQAQPGTATAGAFWLHVPGAPDAIGEFDQISPLLRTVASNGEPTSKPVSKISYGGASANFCRILFGYFPETSEQELVPDESSGFHELEIAACGASPQVRLLSLDSEGKVIDGCGGGDELGGQSRGGTADNAISENGAEAFFTCGGSPIVYARTLAGKTLEVSKPLPADCAEGQPCRTASQLNATYWGASPDGSRVFFTSEQPLVSGVQPGTGQHLYMAVIDAEEVKELIEVSHDPHAGQASETQGVVRISQDGQRIYFVAKGVLTEEPSAEGARPVAGAENLYVYDAKAGRPPIFIADLCSGPEASGSMRDARCPANLSAGEGGEAVNDSGLWRNLNDEAQSTVSGEYLVFASYAKLTSEAGGSGRKIYRYDTTTGRVVRVSLGEEGYDSNGNAGAFDAHIAAPALDSNVAQHMLGDRALTEDGSTVVFTTAAPLSPRAVNGLPNIYVWHEGQVHMISDGSAQQEDAEPAITPSGRDIFFTSVAGLAPQDTDGARDLYDARIDGGFPASPAEEAPCNGGGCQTPLGLVPPLPLPQGSAIQSPGEKKGKGRKSKKGGRHDSGKPHHRRGRHRHRHHAKRTRKSR